MKAYYSVINNYYFCWVPLTHAVLKISNYNIQEIDRCLYSMLHLWDVTYYKSKEPLLVWTTRDVVMCNLHMNYQMDSRNWTTFPLFVPPIPISDRTYWRFVSEVPSYVDKFGTPAVEFNDWMQLWFSFGVWNYKLFKCVLKNCWNNIDKETLVNNDDNDFIINFSAHTCSYHHQIFHHNSQYEVVLTWLLCLCWWEVSMILCWVYKHTFFRSTGFCMSVWCQNIENKI